MAVTFRDGYASPMLRKAVFDRLHPGADVTYEVVLISEAFPSRHDVSEGGAKEAVICTLVCPDGWYVRGVKEIDLREQGRDKKWRDVPQTPEQYTADCTKALGRALRDAGIPQKVDELMALMRWITALDGRPPVSANGRPIDRETGEIRGVANPDDVDQSDAGGSDELTLEQKVALEVSSLDGPDKAKLAKMAKDELGLQNLMRSGEHAEAVMSMIQTMKAPTYTDEEPF